MARRVGLVLVAAGLQAAVGLIAIPAVAAGDGPRLGLTPVGQPGAYFDLTLGPGDQLGIEVEAANFGRERARASTYAADVYSIVNGGFGAELRGRESTSPTTWLSYPSQTITLEPQQALMVPFVVRVPRDTPPGEYITALVIESKGAPDSAGPLALNQVNRSAIAVSIDVPGVRTPKLSIGEVRHTTVSGHSILTFAIDNPGNVHLWPRGRVVVRRAGGPQIAALPVVMDAVYAGRATALEAPLAGVLPPGAYCAQLSLRDATTGASDASDCLVFLIATASGHGSDDELEPELLPATSAMLAVARMSLALLAGVGSIGLALVLAMRRRGGMRQRAGKTRAWSGTSAIGADRSRR